MVSIIIPTYQEGRALPDALQSLLGQTYADSEILVVDDGSTDDTAERVKPFLSRIRYFKRPHCDRQATRNYGLQQARGDYVMICDADIQMKKNCIEKMVGALTRNPDAAFAYSSFKWGWKSFSSFPFDAEKLKEMNYINMASLVRREWHPGFDESIGRLQDWDVWLTIAGKGGYGVYIPEQLFSVGEHRGGLSRWIPSIAYKLPWRYLGIRIAHLDDFARWKEVIQKKHGIYGEK